jgi:hypothetical protein
LEQTKVTTVPNPATGTPPQNGSPCGFALANDGNAIVGSANNTGFVYRTFSHTFTPLSSGPACSTPIASGNGAVVALNGFTYLASSSTVVRSGPTVAYGAFTDFAGETLINSGDVYTRDGQLLGGITGLAAGVLNAPGTRVYGLTSDPSTCGPVLATWDLTVAPVSPGPLYGMLGTPIPLPTIPPNVGVCLSENPPFWLAAITPDDGTVFFAASPNGNPTFPTFITVQPTPP